MIVFALVRPIVEFLPRRILHGFFLARRRHSHRYCSLFAPLAGCLDALRSFSFSNITLKRALSTRLLTMRLKSGPETSKAAASRVCLSLSEHSRPSSWSRAAFDMLPLSGSERFENFLISTVGRIPRIRRRSEQCESYNSNRPKSSLAGKSLSF